MYYCTELESNCRKPNTGMALRAKNDLPAIDFTKSVIVGNSMSDMEFGRNIGAVTVFVTTTTPSVDPADDRVDEVFASLEDFAGTLQSLR